MDSRRRRQSAHLRITDLAITGIAPAPVPEPSSVALFLSAAAGLLVVVKRRRQRA